MRFAAGVLVNSLALELRFAFRERAVIGALAFTLLVASYAVITGKLAIDAQRVELEIMLQETDADQRFVLSQQSDVGSAAYYVHHITYHPPSALAFAALGTREDLPWQHRLRMLAIERQIYEADTGNPDLSRLGRLDFAFLVAVLMPLVLILLLYDLDAKERREGRFELLTATSATGGRTLLVKALARMLLLFVANIAPFALMAAVAMAPLAASLIIAVVTFLHLVFWLLVCRFVTSRGLQAPAAATVLLACWLLFTTVVPAASRIVVEGSVPVPAGGEQLLAQREAVNDAWDLPKAATMDPFIALYPELSSGAAIKESFEWKWYYAFHQMGDEFVRVESDALSAGIERRDRLMGTASVLSPPLATQRWLTHFAETDRKHHQRYVRCVRAFHSALREFHYPMLFDQVEFSLAAMAGLPKYQHCDT